MSLLLMAHGPEQIGPAVEIVKTDQDIMYDKADESDRGKKIKWTNSSFTDNGDGTVTDKLTGLIWLKTADCDGKKMWAEAISYCKELEDGDCGLSDGSSPGDWRLPYVEELHRLQNLLGSGHPFINMRSDLYWSGTKYEGDTYYACSMIMCHGAVFRGIKADGCYYVWPVR